MATMTTEREKLLKRVQMYCFAKEDAALFLDTHPDCAKAIEYYNKYSKLYAESKAEYEKEYGPITRPEEETASSWQWVNDPWPWEESESE